MTDTPGIPLGSTAEWYPDRYGREQPRWQDGYGERPERQPPPAHPNRRHAARVSTAPRVLDGEPAPAPIAPPRGGSQQRRLTTLGLTVLFGASLAVLGAGYLLDVGPLRVMGLLGAIFFGVGTAPMQLSGRLSLATRLGVAGVVGLSTLTLVATVMVLAPLWHPLLAAVIIGAAAAAAHLHACRRALPGLRGSGAFRSLGIGRRVVLDGSVACTIGGTVLWCGAALELGHVVPGVGGFLPQISPLWYVGLVLLLAAIVLARGKSEAYAMFALVSLVAAVTLTPALVYGMPPQSAAKHVDLVQLILREHHLDRGAGIYQAYSGFFAAVAWMWDLARIHDPMGFAAYWPFVIDLVGLAELRFLFGRLIPGGYRIWVGMTIVVLVNSIGDNYFSPQSVGFVLGLGVYGLVLGRDWPGLSDRRRITLLLLAGCSLAVTHELSPYIVGGVLAVLVVSRAARPWYAPGTCILPAALWALYNRHVLTGFATLADLGNLSNFTPPKTISARGLHRLAIVGESSHALLLGLLVLIALAGVGFVRTMRLSPAWGFLISAGVGLLVMTVNPYGNEGIFRAALFGIPWLGILAMATVPGTPRRWVSAGFGLVSVGLLATFLVSSFGLDNAYVIRSADLQAYSVYENQAPASSYLLNLCYGGDLPTDVTFPQASHLLSWTAMVTQDTFRPGQPNAADVAALAQRYLRYAADNGDAAPSELYAIWSPASAEYSADYGLETLSHAQAWRKLMASSPDWRVVFSRDGTYLFRVAAAAPPPRAR